MADRFHVLFGNQRGLTAADRARAARNAGQRWWLDTGLHAELGQWIDQRVAAGYRRLAMGTHRSPSRWRLTLTGVDLPAVRELDTSEMLWVLDRWPGSLRDSAEDDSDEVSGWLTEAAARDGARRAGFRR